MQLNNVINVAAAGAGKTYSICSDALQVIESNDTNKRILILSYTNRGVDSIKAEIRKQNMGVLCSQIQVMTWYRFLLNEMIKPYQSVIFDINEVKSIDFSDAYGKVNYNKIGTRGRYLNATKDIRSNVMAELALYINEKCGKKMVERLAETYVHIYIDEVQDMAGYDLNIIETLMKSDAAITYVGDNKQATFRTNNSVKNKKMSGTNIWTFFQKMINDKIVLMNKNLVSRRFNREICNFANLVYPNENNISTSMNEITEHDGVFLIKNEDVKLYYDYYAPTILKYDRKTATDNYYSYNFGECKGMTFQRVLIYPNGPFLDFLLRRKKLSSPQKYYVAATRAKYSIAFVVESLPGDKDWLIKENLKIGDKMIEVMRYKTV